MGHKKPSSLAIALITVVGLTRNLAFERLYQRTLSSYVSDGLVKLASESVGLHNEASGALSNLFNDICDVIYIDGLSPQI